MNVFGNLGGLLGLYLGLSVLSILEVVDFFYDIYEMFTIAGKQKKHKQLKQQKLEKEKTEDSLKKPAPGSQETDSTNQSTTPDIEGQTPINSHESTPVVVFDSPTHLL